MYRSKSAGNYLLRKGCDAPGGNREYFYEQLDRLFPGVKEKYIYTYGYQYMLDSPHNGYLMQIFHDTRKKHGIMHDNEQIFAYLSAFEEKENFRQLSLWD